MLVGETVFGERAVMPYLVAIDTMPKIAFAPLFIAWLGFGIASKVALATFIATFPIVVGTAAGLHAADENARMLFRTMGASRWQTLVKLKLPTGLPHFFTGLKIASVGVMAGAITGEFLGGGKGFGELIRDRGVAARHAARLLADHLSEPARPRDVRDRRLDPAPLRVLAEGECRRRAELTGPRGKCHGLDACLVMPALVAGIHVLNPEPKCKTWMAGTSPAMTWIGCQIQNCWCKAYFTGGL